MDDRLRLYAESYARNRCTNAITMLPSPTLAATRLTEPARTSPTAKIPGTDVRLEMILAVRVDHLGVRLDAENRRRELASSRRLILRRIRPR